MQVAWRSSRRRPTPRRPRTPSWRGLVARSGCPCPGPLTSGVAPPVGARWRSSSPRARADVGRSGLCAVWLRLSARTGASWRRSRFTMDGSCRPTRRRPEPTSHKGLAVQDVQPTVSQLMGVIRRSVRQMIMPTVQLADGTWLQDST